MTQALADEVESANASAMCSLARFSLDLKLTQVATQSRGDHDT
jgi:hypothetical protein